MSGSRRTSAMAGLVRTAAFSFGFLEKCPSRNVASIRPRLQAHPAYPPHLACAADRRGRIRSPKRRRCALDFTPALRCPASLRLSRWRKSPASGGRRQCSRLRRRSRECEGDDQQARSIFRMHGIPRWATKSVITIIEDVTPG